MMLFQCPNRCSNAALVVGLKRIVRAIAVLFNDFHKVLRIHQSSTLLCRDHVVVLENSCKPHIPLHQFDWHSARILHVGCGNDALKYAAKIFGLTV